MLLIKQLFVLQNNLTQMHEFLLILLRVIILNNLANVKNNLDIRWVIFQLVDYDFYALVDQNFIVFFLLTCDDFKCEPVQLNQMFTWEIKLLPELTQNLQTPNFDFIRHIFLE